MQFEPLYLAGQWCEGTGREAIVDPYRGTVVREVAQAGEAEADRAAQAAVEARDAARGLSAHARISILEEIAVAIEDSAGDLVSLLIEEGGKPRRFAEGEVGRAVRTFQIAAQEVARGRGQVVPLDLEPRSEGYFGMSLRVPRGGVLAITPFNFPLNLVAHKIAPAIASGSPVVLKPPPQAPTAALRLATFVAGTAWPDGGLSVLPSSISVAERLVVDDRFATISFTGSDAVGWRIRERAGKKKVLLELGGNAAAIVHGDADLDWALERLVFGSFAHAGQVCIKVQRILVERPAFDEFRSRFLESSAHVVCGDPSDRETLVGPMIDAAAADRVESWVSEAIEAGARVELQGRRENNLLTPWVLTAVPDSARVACQEVFGPVTLLEPYDDFTDAIARVNASRYGLQAGVFTRDLDRARRAVLDLEVGGVIVNDVPTFRVDQMPYGGVKDSGRGREGPACAIDELTEIRFAAFRFSS